MRLRSSQVLPVLEPGMFIVVYSPLGSCYWWWMLARQLLTGRSSCLVFDQLSC